MKTALLAVFALLAPLTAGAAPHAARDLLGAGNEAAAARSAVFLELGQALGGAEAMDPDQRSTAVAMVLGAALCPDTVSLADVSPELRGDTLLSACGPFLPDDADPGVLLASEGCRPLLGALSPHAQRLVLGPGALLLLAWKREGAAAPGGLPDSGCRIAMVPTLLAPVRKSVPAVAKASAGLRLTVDKGAVRMTLTDGRGLRLVRAGEKLTAKAAGPGTAIAIAALPGVGGPIVDRAAVREAAVAVHALLGGQVRRASIVATPETPYVAIVVVLDALRGGTPGAEADSLFPDVTIGVEGVPDAASDGVMRR